MLLGERKGRCQLKAGTAAGVGSIREVQRWSVLRLKIEWCLVAGCGLGACLKHWVACSAWHAYVVQDGVMQAAASKRKF